MTYFHISLNTLSNTRMHQAMCHHLIHTDLATTQIQSLYISSDIQIFMTKLIYINNKRSFFRTRTHRINTIGDRHSIKILIDGTIFSMKGAGFTSAQNTNPFWINVSLSKHIHIDKYTIIGKQILKKIKRFIIKKHITQTNH